MCRQRPLVEHIDHRGVGVCGFFGAVFARLVPSAFVSLRLYCFCSAASVVLAGFRFGLNGAGGFRVVLLAGVAFSGRYSALCRASLQWLGFRCARQALRF